MSGNTNNGKRFQRLPGTARQYLDTTTGKIYTRRQYDQLPAGTRNQVRGPQPAEVRRVTSYKQQRFNQFVASYAERQRNAGVQVVGKNGKPRPYGRGDTRTDPEFKRLMGELKAKNKDGRPAKLRQKKALIALGMRDHIPYTVTPGDSQKWLRQQRINALNNERKIEDWMWPRGKRPQ